MASVNWLKMTMQKAGALRVHFEDEDRQERKHSNRNIDPKLTKFNFKIGCDSYKNAMQKLKNRVQYADKRKPPKRVRKDRITCVMLEVPCPSSIRDKEQFFRDVHKVYCRFFGHENVCGSFIHADEVHNYKDVRTGDIKQSLEHMHTIVVPYTEEKGVNGKAFETRGRLSALNRRLDRMVRKKYHVGLNTGEIAMKKSVEQLKTESKLKKTKEKVEAVKKDFENLKVLRDSVADQVGASYDELYRQRTETTTLERRAEKEREKLWKAKEEKKRVLEEKEKIPDYHTLYERFNELMSHIKQLYRAMRKKGLLREVEKETALMPEILEETRGRVSVEFERVR